MTGSTPAASRPGLFLRLAVVVYDALVLLAVLFLATALVLPITKGQAIEPEHPLFQLYLLAVAFLYLGWFWTRAGQTVAMRAWRLRVVDLQGRRIGWSRAGLRFLAALLSWAGFGLGFVWVALDPHKRAWHDILSATRVVQDPRPK